MAGETAKPYVDDKAKVAADDARVFDALAQAEKQYDEYLKISQTASLASVWADSLAPPPSDVPLTLTIWPEK